MAGERKPTSVWNWRNETDGLELLALGPKVTAVSFKSSLTSLKPLKKREKKNRQTGKTDFDVEGQSVI